MSIIPKEQSKSVNRPEMGWLDRVAKDLLFAKLHKITQGHLRLEHEGQITEFGVKAPNMMLNAHIRIDNPACFKAIVFGGEPAAGKAYVDAWWSSESVIDVLRLLILNREVMFSLDADLGLFARYAFSALHFLRKNNRLGSKKNISAHYDIGNDLYALFLDPSMMYSSAYFSDGIEHLEDASINKLRVICEKLDLSENDHVLEIGTGWGGFAIYAAKNYNCRITTTTISDEQHAYAEKSIEKAGLQDRITLLKQDYRELQGEYDKLVSIEMIEAVGHQYMDNYFEVCSQRLKPNGTMLIQAITISDYLYQDYLRSVDFIQKYIFPGGCLTSMHAMLDSVSRKTNLSLFHSEAFASSYAKTLQLWHQRFINNSDKVLALAYPPSFIRLWEYYLKYCQAGFEERVIDVQHLCFKKPRSNYELGSLK
ncbi:MAG: class I SAM-dependent methyltransferase [Proteobacteria bacterium]|nr:class I SAM-dependent methyltransferase [Pseudomonadota bacterium]